MICLLAPNVVQAPFLVEVTDTLSYTSNDWSQNGRSFC